MHEYKVIRSNRKKVKLELSPSGLVIKAPYEMTDDQIAQIVREKSDWIAEHPGSGVARFAAVSVKGRCLRTGVPSVIQMQAISQVGRAAGVLTQKYGLKDSPERSYVV